MTPSHDPLYGLNPAELMAAAAMPTDDGADTMPVTARDLPTLEEIAQAFPDLEILDLIGHGGMSAVFRGRQPKLDRLVALKVLPKSLAATPGFAERFSREGRVLARLNHPSIVAVHDFGESGGFCFLTMEHVDGVNLRQAMRAGRFTPEQALVIIPTICDALQYAHSQGVLHRDIKPENILLDTSGKVKIADFGIAKILDEKGGDAMLLTQSGAKLGTAPYMAPEQIEQPSTVDHRADIYSLGVVFYEMLTGELPLGRFAAPSERSNCHGNVDKVVFRALEKERGRRQQSADELKTQIEGLKSEPVVQMTVPSSRRVAILSAVFVGLSALVGWMIYFAVTTSTDKITVARMTIPLIIWSAGILLCALSLPLWLKLVPRNSIYGVRLPSTLTSDERWYAVNAHFGKGLFAWSLLIIGAGIAGVYQLPRHQDSYPWAALALTLVAIVASVIRTLWWMRLHPVDKPALPKNRLASWFGQAVVAIAIAMFIKGFIAGAYRVPQGNEPGVAKNSHWLASHLDTGFATGDLIIFEHESRNYWIARVVARDTKGLRLKRGGSPDEFFVPWEKIVGKMLFSHFTPDALDAASSLKSVSSPPKSERAITEGTSQALEQPPVLRFTRLKLNDTEWRWPVYGADGNTIDNSISQPLINASSQTNFTGPDPDVCRWQLWFEHPDIDRRSMISVSITALDGSELPELVGDIAGPGFGEDHPPLYCVVVSPGKKGRLPPAVRMVLRYSIGPWRTGSEVASAFQGGMALGSGYLAGMGEGHDQRAFLSWVKKADDLQPDVIARLRTGQWIDSEGWLKTGSEGQLIHQFTFGARLADVELFHTRSRTIRSVVFDKVIIPPLPDDRNAKVKVQAEKLGTPTPRPIPAVPVTPGSAKALKTEPSLRFLRMKSNKDDWSQNLYDPTGQLVTIPPETAQALKAMHASISSKAPDICWLQIWFQHPDFEPASEISVKLVHPVTGSSLDANPRSFSHRSSTEGLLGFLPIAVGAGKQKDLPKHATVKLKYSIGMWEEPSKLEVTNRTSISTSSWLFGAIGETPKEGSFVTWTRMSEERQVQCVAHLKDGTSIAGGSGSTGSNGITVDFARFDFGLAEIDSFTLRSRAFREVTFENVTLPPLE